jgi:hypothetical protein
VTNFARSLAQLAGSLPHRVKVASLAGLIAGCAALAAAPSAQAEVVSIGPIPTGIQARVGATGATKPFTYANPEGHPVVHGESVYAIYWDPTDHYHGDWQWVTDQYFRHLGESSGQLNTVFSIATQYTDKTNVPANNNTSFHGAYTDTTPYPTSGNCTDPNPLQAADLIGPGLTPVCLTSTQVAAQLEAFIAAHKLPKGMSTIYFLMTPPAVTVCLDGGGAAGHCSEPGNTAELYEHSFCSYHAYMNPGGLPTGDANTVLYGVVPWVAGGFGDPHLTGPDQTAAWDCQDGGFNPTSKPPGELEHPKEKNTKEKEAFEQADKEEKEKIEEQEEFEGPHEQEPNQQPCPPPTPDGGCDTGLADMIITQLGNEQLNIVTDPLLNAWKDSTGAENTDECRFDFADVIGGSVTALELSHAGTLYNQLYGGVGTYYINDAFNLAALRLSYPGIPCLPGGRLLPEFTAPNPVNSGEVVGFDGMESDITLNAAVNFPGGGAPASNYANYYWTFGDGTSATGYAPGAPACETPWLSPCAASIFHSYTYGGTYMVTLTVTDVGGHRASVSHEITVDGPPPPGAPNGAGGPGSPSGSGSGSVTGAGHGTPPPGKPVASAAVVSLSLKTALRKGVAVGYSVNEQVTGHFEVLMARSLAHKLKIGGTPAVGLPAGTPPEIVIAKAFLVTTKAGRSVMHVKLPKSVAARLRHAHKAPLMLRLIVRNAASTNPETTTVITAATLVH